MIRIQQLKLPLDHKEADLKKKIEKTLHLLPEEPMSFEIIKKSVDARKKQEISFVYTVDVSVKNENRVLKKVKSSPNILISKKNPYIFPETGEKKLAHPPVIVGSGPCGLFCAYELAVHGFAPILIERGSDVEKRTKAVARFWETGELDLKTNVQFGEGGAGTFSDGKLNTLVKDAFGRNREALKIFTRMGAPSEIMYENKPHIGTDILVDVLKNIRREIISHGGSILFETCMTDLKIESGRITAVQLNHEKWLETDALILAIGHSARDTFALLEQKKISMEAKSFAVGLRVEHPQQMINENQYGNADMAYLPVAPYKVTAQSKNGRGVYSFCMCPGGYVVNASSEQNRLAVNGMSYYKRDGANANSAVIVAVTPADYNAVGPLAGVAFQRNLEEKAWKLCQGKIPQQLYGDFRKGISSKQYGDFPSCTKGTADFADLSGLFSEEIRTSFIEGMESFSGKIRGFNRYDAILSGVESRTSSPVRIHRNENFESNINGIFPAGEGAGYAGGIMSAAMDGMKTAEAVAKIYRPL